MSSTNVLADTETPSTSPPAVATTSVGFKDWALICEALGNGQQSLILRKGGIAEGRDGFRFKHESFFLFPTQFHQQQEKMRPAAVAKLGPMVPPPAGTVEIRYFFVLEHAVWIDDWATVARLEPLHGWREDVIRERFAYDEQCGLQCAFGRVYRLEPAWSFPDRPAYGGCRSWVTLPDLPLSTVLTPVLDQAQHGARALALEAVIGLP